VVVGVTNGEFVNPSDPCLTVRCVRALTREATSHSISHQCSLLNRLCTIAFCTFTYTGLAHPDEVAFVCSIALQAYFEGRAITKEDMDKCINFWRENIAEESDPIRRKRQVCCEPYYVPCPEGTTCHAMCHPKRDIPYPDEHVTPEIREVRCLMGFAFVATVHGDSFRNPSLV
jgi:hypothetical protein